MDFVGVVTEYDPFHSGHAAQLAMLRERGLNVSGEILTVEEMEVELCRLRSSI